MVSSRRIIACIVLSLSVAAFAQAQSSAAKEQTGSVSGKVTVKSKSVAGIIVVATEANQSGGQQQPRFRGTTDEEGNYRINDIPPGNYFMFPLAPALVDKAQSRRLLTIAAGESIRDVDFVMVSGGVITGRITNADGQPLVEELVEVLPVDNPLNYISHQLAIHTDDRGIYRAFGLRPGKYRISVGQSMSSLPGHVRQTYSQTFYPSVTEISKATAIEVTEGGEIRDVDIVVGSLTTFTISGRVIDGTRKPVPGVVLGVGQTEGHSTVTSTGIATSGSNGEFKLQNVIPGKYTLFIAPMAKSADVRSDPLAIEVIDRDLTDLEIKTKKGAGLSGMVVLEGSYEKSVADMLKGLRVFAWMDGSPHDYDGGSRSVAVGADGSFRLAGLASGNARLGFTESDESHARQFEILQVEHNGVVQPSGVSLKEGEQVDGVRIVVRHLKLIGAIRGQVKIENGELPPNARIVVWVSFADRSRAGVVSPPSPEVDSRGRFILERLAAATYELRIAVFDPRKRLSRDEPKVAVTVTDNAVTEVTLTVKLKP